ncbi:tetratricopeptide repeat protein [bacterium]|nr:tetratricopeptide repeat protein [bacterium]
MTPRLASLVSRLQGRRSARAAFPVSRLGRRPVPRAAFPVSLAAALCAALCAFGAAPPTAPPVEAGAALDAYERGDCRAAVAAFEALPADGAWSADGALQYRYGWCLGALGRPEAAERQRRAAELLAAAAARPGATVETPFYLVNALQNFGRAEEARREAAAAVERYKSGALLVPAAEPQAWFQLGKLFRDAGDDRGALAPFRRALDAGKASGRPLRAAYLQRILAAAEQARDAELTRAAGEALAAKDPGNPAAANREARLLAGQGKLAEARAAFAKLQGRQNDAGMDAQYAGVSLDRVLELAEWGAAPATKLADGREVAALGEAELRNELAARAREAWGLMKGPTVEVPRRRGPGTRPAPPAATREALRALQARFCGALLEAVVRGAPLQQWAIIDGYPQLLHHPWDEIYVQQGAGDRSEHVVPAD